MEEGFGEVVGMHLAVIKLKIIHTKTRITISNSNTFSIDENAMRIVRKLIDEVFFSAFRPNSFSDFISNTRECDAQFLFAIVRK